MNPTMVTPQWTARRVMDEHPDVMVDCGGYGVLKAKVTGVFGPYAKVSIYGHPWYCEVKWETIAASLNSGRALVL